MAQRFFDFYINSSIHVALAVVSFLFVTKMALQIEISPSLYAFVFFSTISGYNFVKYASIAGLHHRSLVASLKVIQVFSLLCVFPLVYLMFQLSVKSLGVLLLCGMLTFLYAIPVGFKKNLRTYAGLKIIIVSLVWSLVTVLLPLVAIEVEIDVDMMITFVQRFFIVIVLVIPFEIRDVFYDDTSLQTLPQKTGLVFSKTLGVILLAIVLLLEGFKDVTSMYEVKSLFIIVALIVFLLLRSSSNQSKYFASFLVEAVPIFWALGYYAFY